MDNNEYSLNWRDHSKHVCRGFSSLLDNNYLTDVTLHCEGKKIGAHKTVLSICSSYFNDIFKEMPSGQHPVIIVYGVKYETLIDILQFIYKGEASIDNSKLEMFLKVSQMFQINGLTENETKQNIEFSTCGEQRGMKRAMNDSNVEVQNKLMKDDSRLSPSLSFVKSEPSEDDARDPFHDFSGNTDIEEQYLQEADFKEESLLHYEEEIKDEIETNSEVDYSHETEQEVEEDSSKLIPEKSRYKYEKTWTDFKEWRRKKASSPVLNEAVVLEYFTNLSKKLKYSSLSAKFWMLKKALVVNLNVDISRFDGYTVLRCPKITMERCEMHIFKFTKVMEFMKKQNVDYVPRKLKILSSEQCRKFILEASDDFLLSKVVLIFGLYGACPFDDLAKLTVDDIEDHGNYALVKLQDAKTHTTRTFIIPDSAESSSAAGGGSLNPYEIYKKYADLRPSNVTTKRFFLGYKNRKCVAKPCCVFAIGSVPKEVAKFLGLDRPEDFTRNGLKYIGAKWAHNPGRSVDVVSIEKLVV